MPIRTGESFATFILPASADQYDVRFPQQHRLPIASIEEMLFIDQAEITVRENHDIEKSIKIAETEYNELLGKYVDIKSALGKIISQERHDFDF